MSKVETLFKWLAAEPCAEADHILCAALEHAEATYAARIASILLARQTDAAWAALIHNLPRLEPEHRRRVLEAGPRMHGGLSAAIQVPGSPGRRNALALLAEQPKPELCFLIVETLRDPDVETRKSAGQLLRRYAEDLLVESERLTRMRETPSDAFVRGRTELGRALREALRTYDAHERPETLEVCLWFARDLVPELWTALNQTRSSCGTVVEKHLRAWDSPRLAGFLLLALGQSNWRSRARQVLDDWTDASELIALVRNSDLIEDPEVARGLGHLKHPPWFAANVNTIAQLPPDVRARMPYWLLHLGFNDTERIYYLENWQASDMPELHRAAVYALTAMETQSALKLLERVASRACPMCLFAQWYITGRRILQSAQNPAAAASQTAMAATGRGGFR